MELGLDVGPAQGLGPTARGRDQPPVPWCWGALWPPAPGWGPQPQFGALSCPSRVGVSSKAFSGEREAI